MLLRNATFSCSPYNGITRQLYDSNKRWFFEVALPRSRPGALPIVEAVEIILDLYNGYYSDMANPHLTINTLNPRSSSLVTVSRQRLLTCYWT